ncbi:helix-turn-helix domain-containing protein [Mesorhizobium sp. ASY16-5R]|uniref:helix-turn-helix domain-containing protein n=1 Tax=Mesorhizobium sp. ASY16-5R TaxID=3445772 RepID=UPI003F9FD4D5
MTPVDERHALAEEIERLQAGIDRLREMVRPAPLAESCTDAEIDFLPHNCLSVGSAARRFGVSKQTVRRWARDDGVGMKIGGRLRISIPRMTVRKMVKFR